MRLIDADWYGSSLLLYLNSPHVIRYGNISEGMRIGIKGCMSLLDAERTVDAVPIDEVAQMLYEAFGDLCPCNYNDNDEWLPNVCDNGELCGEHDDPLYCLKQYIKHYRERTSDGGENE